jgi:[acyl-carrier-protein] S-malonyltransferase
MKTAFIFPGQGSQYVGMGKALAERFSEAREVFSAADDALNEKLSTLCFEGPEIDLKQTANTQPAILTTSLAVHAVFSKRCAVAPVALAGHSLGEYSALVAAGALSLSDGVKAVRARGSFMQEAVPAGVGAMSAVLGLPPEQVAAVCAQVAQGETVSCANFNDPGQTVIAGHTKAVERAGEALKAAGAKRVLPLPVSAPFHCTLMQPVVPRLEAVLRTISFAPMKTAVVSNVEATANQDATRIQELLLRQVTGSVRWIETVQHLETLGVTRVIELGPGKVLSGLVKRISKSIEILNVEDVASLEKTLSILEATP